MPLAVEKKLGISRALRAAFLLLSRLFLLFFPLRIFLHLLLRYFLHLLLCLRVRHHLLFRPVLMDLANVGYLTAFHGSQVVT